MTALLLNVPRTIELTLDQFEQLAIANPELRLELTATGGLLLMPPTGGETGQRNSDISGQLWYWNRQNALGQDFDSSTGFRLPNGAVRAPDASWLTRARWAALSPEQRQKFLPLCPDFAIELLSPSDELSQTQAKMQEYLDNGLRLGWLINPRDRSVEVYRPGQPVERVVNPKSLSGEAVLPGFTLDLSRVW